MPSKLYTTLCFGNMPLATTRNNHNKEWSCWYATRLSWYHSWYHKIHGTTDLISYLHIHSCELLFRVQVLLPRWDRRFNTLFMLIIKPMIRTISQIYFDKELYMFQTGLLSIIRSLNTVYTAIGICHVDCLLADSQNKSEK